MENIKPKGITFSNVLAQKVADGSKTMTRRLLGNVSIKKGQHLYVREAWCVGAEHNQPKGSSHIPSNATVIYSSDKSWGLFGRRRLARFMPKKFARTWLIVIETRIERLQDISETEAMLEGIQFTSFPSKPPRGKMSIDGGKTFYPMKPVRQNGYHYKPVNGSDECHYTARTAFASLWNSIYGTADGHKWEDNPWVSVITFRKIPKPHE